MNNTVFVYGSLLSGHANHHLLGGSKCLGEAQIYTDLEMVSFGGFPGLVQADQPNLIIGELYEVSDQVFRRLDQLEGYPSFYDREIVTADLADSYETDAEFMDAWVYTLRDKTTRYENLPRISSNNWRIK